MHNFMELPFHVRAGIPPQICYPDAHITEHRRHQEQEVTLEVRVTQKTDTKKEASKKDEFVDSR